MEDAWVHNPKTQFHDVCGRWDVESITSTYSNTDNHPKVLKDSTINLKKSKEGKLIKLSNKTGMPILEEEGEDEVGSDEEEEYVRVNKVIARMKGNERRKKLGNRL